MRPQADPPHLAVPPAPVSGPQPNASVTPTTGAAGTTVTLAGNGLAGTTAVSFGGVAASFQVMSDSQVTAVVPAGAPSGTVTRVVTEQASLSPAGVRQRLARRPVAAWWRKLPISA